MVFIFRMLLWIYKAKIDFTPLFDASECYIGDVVLFGFSAYSKQFFNQSYHKNLSSKHYSTIDNFARSSLLIFVKSHQFL